MTSAATIRQRALAGEGENLNSRISYTDAERDGVHMQKVRLAKLSRAGSDWDGKPANDNIAWPLATALIREGNTELLKIAMYYRRVHDTAKSEAKLGGSSVSIGDGVALDRHTVIRANGSIAYKHVRQRTAADIDIPAKQYVAPYDDTETEVQRNVVMVPKPWKGDEPVNNMIDAQGKLAGLQAHLGPLVEPLEMAVIDCATYQVIGNASGVADRSGSIAAGRAIVHMALVSLRDGIGKIKRADIAA